MASSARARVRVRSQVLRLAHGLELGYPHPTLATLTTLTLTLYLAQGLERAHERGQPVPVRVNPPGGQPVRVRAAIYPLLRVAAAHAGRSERRAQAIVHGHAKQHRAEQRLVRALGLGLGLGLAIGLGIGIGVG